MKCRDVQRCVHAYIDAELAPEQLLEVDAHIAACAECQRRVEFERWFKGEIRETLGRFSAPTGLSSRVEASLLRDHRVQRLRKLAPRIGLAAAVAACVAAALVLPEWLNPAVQAPLSPRRDVIDYVARQHARGLPLEVSGPDANSVAQWFRGKVDFAVQPPAFHREHVKLVGGRLSHVGDQQAAYLFYEHNGRPLTVVVFDASSGLPPGGIHQQAGGRDVFIGQSLGYNVATWSQGGVSYALSSDLDQNDMIRLVSSVP